MSASADEVGTRSVILTGPSRGLGAALFHALQADGARVFGLARTFTSEQLALAARLPGTIRLRVTDLADQASLPSAAELAAFVGPSRVQDEVVLLHNAATIEPIGLVGELSPAAVLSAVQLNLLAPILLTNTFLAALPPGPTPLRVMYVASSAARSSYPGWATYCATKAGAEAFMRCAADAASRPCSVEVIDPGALETAMQQTLRDLGSGMPGHERLVQRHRAGDLGDPLTVAKTILNRYFPPLDAASG